MVQDSADEAPLLFRQDGVAGFITLNRPRQLNALTPAMVAEAHAVLARWKNDPAIDRVVIQGQGGKAFCAGGDIRLLHSFGQSGRRPEALAFWRDEYRLNRVLKTYPKPILSLMDGIVMGGGVGMSAHGPYRIGTEKTAWAMPEVNIGYFPDVGASHLLAALPGQLGAFLAVTGHRLHLGDALAFGLVTHAVQSADVAALTTALAGPEPIDSILSRFARKEPPGPIAGERSLIDRCFSGDSVASIHAAVAWEAGHSALAASTLATMNRVSPLSMAIALEQVRRARSLSFDEGLQMEFRIVSRMVDGSDFYEGVRALLIDKDQNPSWQPATIGEVSPAIVARYFAPLDQELEFMGL